MFGYIINLSISRGFRGRVVRVVHIEPRAYYRCRVPEIFDFLYEKNYRVSLWNVSGFIQLPVVDSCLK